MVTVKGVGTAMVAAEEAAMAAVEQADDGQGGRGAVYFVLVVIIYCHTAETSLFIFCPPQFRNRL